MKHLIILLFLASLCSCTSKENKTTTEGAEQNAKTTPVIQAKKPIEQPKQPDPQSFEYLLQLSDNIIKEIPRYHIEKFIGTDWDDEDDPYRKIYSEDTDHYKLHDNYVLTFSVSIHGVANETVLATFTSDGKRIDHIGVAQSSDMDLSSTSYSSQSFKIFSDSLVRVLDQTTKAKNYDYMMPDSLDLFDLDSTEVIETTKYTHFVIQNSGEIKEVMPQQTILDETELRTLSKAELRLKRNEFFARLGYIFKSEDLRTHFENTSWYEPEFEDVTSKLTAYDKYNINIIKRIENEK
ncbi:MAG: YARHG domain-containing protein [Reichenbachiella sp.]|uniref:YARHG domain-containing protein n=1 Tax=Reichenbachiella sp. TaxID=2184521 RepID=UPI0029674656|nr:YARHG domain-containing protein [Reichenbachiella sp.]MDW3209097.1 YARHG domain-containing protein [Reichenbachiella sp.]